MAVDAAAATPATPVTHTTPCDAGADQPVLSVPDDMPRSQAVRVRTDADARLAVERRLAARRGVDRADQLVAGEVP